MRLEKDCSFKMKLLTLASQEMPLEFDDSIVDLVSFDSPSETLEEASRGFGEDPRPQIGN